MSYQNFGLSTPDSVIVAYQRIQDFLNNEEGVGASKRIYSTSRIYDIATDVGFAALAEALARLVAEGRLERILRVEPQLPERTADFQSLEEVPSQIENWRRPGEVVQVVPEFLRVYYRLKK